jgi:tetratricopeptide (TPR) repeat protein
MVRSIEMKARAALFLGVLAGCATTKPPPPAESPSGQARIIQMEEVRIQPAVDPLTGLDTFDAGDLLERGNQLFDAQAYDHAIKVYDKLITTFTDSSLVPTALYNSGLAYENLSEFGQALDRFERIIREHTSSTTAKDAHFRATLCLSKLGRWKEVADSFWAVRQMEGLSVMDDLESRVGLGVAMFMQDDYATAEREFLSAIRFYEDQSKQEFLPAQYWVGQARFYLGEIYAREMESVPLRSEKREGEAWKEEMAKRLEEKCDLLLRAQNNFVRAIRVGHTGWATASGYRIGSMYERLYDEMLAVEIPPDLPEGSKPYYIDALKEKIGVLVSKAIQVYERSLEMAERVGEKNEWVERTSRALERMKALALEAIRG